MREPARIFPKQREEFTRDLKDSGLHEKHLALQVKFRERMRRENYLLDEEKEIREVKVGFRWREELSENASELFKWIIVSHPSYTDIKTLQAMAAAEELDYETAMAEIGTFGIQPNENGHVHLPKPRVD